MSPAGQREETLSLLALERPAAERAAFLGAVCGSDEPLRARIEALLAAREVQNGLLAGRPDAGGKDGPRDGDRGVSDLTVSTDEEVGQTLGRYKLLERIGEGGFGVVHVAEQTEPVRRRVALKVIKLGMDTRQVVARFEAERQALAMMDHPNIAKVLDAGTTESHRPYFVMELVRGIKITDYCDQAQLSTRDRLDLFTRVCHAIQHAHQKGIIHRDIKPSNILVTLHDGVAVPKVIDFGIAKATEQRLTDATVYTQLHQFIGTPAYMSPEQAEMSGLDIDTRSDIYSLGVLLYELLTGSTPFDPTELMSSGIEAMRKTIREKEPPRPSTRLATLAAEQLTATARRRSADASRLLHQLKGDLDWIVMKCLEKDRQRRYDTANGLAADLRRHLDNEPVQARPPSAAYRFQKLLRRNKVLSAATALVLTAVLVGTAVSIAQALRARRELRRALVAEANARAALHFIQDDVLSQASPGYQPDRELTVRALIDRIAGRLDQATGRPPQVEASIRQTLGSVYAELGDYARAAQQYEGALQLQREHLGEGHSDTLRSLYGLAMARWWNGDIARAGPVTREGLETSRRVLGERAPLTLQFMQAHAYVTMFLGEVPWTELEPFILQALALHRECRDELGSLKLIQGLCSGYTLNWQPAKAESLTVEALDRSQRVLGDHPDTGILTINLGWIYEQLNQLDRAEELILRSLELRRRVLGEDSPRTLSSHLLLARIHVQERRFEEARPRVEDILARIRGRPAMLDDLYLPYQVGELGWAYLEQGHVAEADTFCVLALEAMRRRTDANPLVLPRVLTALGAVRLAQERYAEAEALLRESALLAEKRWPEAAYPFHVTSLLGASLAGQKRYAEAEPLLLRGHDGLLERRASLPPYLDAARRLAEAIERLVRLYDAWGKPAEATGWRKKLADLERERPASDGPRKDERP
jgi:serine/threonine protein kinase/Tfp pilus assembly protein PilF